jgi:hypothetical protein
VKFHSFIHSKALERLQLSILTSIFVHEIIISSSGKPNILHRTQLGGGGGGGGGGGLFSVNMHHIYPYIV